MTIEIEFEPDQKVYLMLNNRVQEDWIKKIEVEIVDNGYAIPVITKKFYLTNIKDYYSAASLFPTKEALLQSL